MEAVVDEVVTGNAKKCKPCGKRFVSDILKFCSMACRKKSSSSTAPKCFKCNKPSVEHNCKSCDTSHFCGQLCHNKGTSEAKGMEESEDEGVDSSMVTLTKGGFCFETVVGHLLVKQARKKWLAREVRSL